MTITDLKDITSFKWATVMGISPLSIKMDGDTAALALIPDSLIDPLSLTVGNRVRVELSLRKVVIHGSSNGGSTASAGEVKMTAAIAAPVGWLLCHGQSLSRTSYAGLFTAIGTTYGSANSTMFTIPDMRGRVAVGMDSSQVEFDVLGETGGAKTHTLSTAEMPSHTHNIKSQSANNPSGDFADAGYQRSWQNAYTLNNTSNISPTGGGGAHNNLQPYRVLNYIIKI